MRIRLCPAEGCDGMRVSLGLAVAWTQIVQIDAPHDGGGLGGELGLTVEP